MKVGVRFTDGTGVEFDTTEDELNAGFSRGCLQLVREGTKYWIPLSSLVFVTSDVGSTGKSDRGFFRK